MNGSHYTLPEDVAGTVFDPRDETFGPIMAALQAGDFEQANRLMAGLVDPTGQACPHCRSRDTYRTNLRPLGGTHRCNGCGEYFGAESDGTDFVPVKTGSADPAYYVRLAAALNRRVEDVWASPVPYRFEPSDVRAALADAGEPPALGGVYVVYLDPDIAGEDNAVCAFADESDADDIVTILEASEGEGKAWAHFEPLVYGMEDPGIREVLRDRLDLTDAGLDAALAAVREVDDAALAAVLEAGSEA